MHPGIFKHFLHNLEQIYIAHENHYAVHQIESRMVKLQNLCVIVHDLGEETDISPNVTRFEVKWGSNKFHFINMLKQLAGIDMLPCWDDDSEWLDLAITNTITFSSLEMRKLREGFSKSEFIAKEKQLRQQLQDLQEKQGFESVLHTLNYDMSEEFIILIKNQNKGNCGGPPKPPNTYTVGNLQDCYRLRRLKNPPIKTPRPEVREKRPPSTFGTIMAKVKERSENPPPEVKEKRET